MGCAYCTSWIVYRMHPKYSLVQRMGYLVRVQKRIEYTKCIEYGMCAEYRLGQSRGCQQIAVLDNLWDALHSSIWDSVWDMFICSTVRYVSHCHTI